MFVPILFLFLDPIDPFLVETVDDVVPVVPIPDLACIYSSLKMIKMSTVPKIYTPV